MSKELEQARFALDRFKGGEGKMILAEDLFDILKPLIQAVENLETQKP